MTQAKGSATITREDRYMIDLIMAGSKRIWAATKVREVLGKEGVPTKVLAEEFNRVMPSSYHAGKRQGRWMMMYDDLANEKVYGAIKRINATGLNATPARILEETRYEIPLADDHDDMWLYRIIITLLCRHKVETRVEHTMWGDSTDSWWAVSA